MRSKLPFVLALSLTAAAHAQSPVAPDVSPELLTPLRNVPDRDPLGSVRARAVRVDVATLKRLRVGQRLKISLFEDAAFVARFDSLEVEPKLKNTFHWRGELVGKPGSTFVITVHENAMWGWFHANDPKLGSLVIQGAYGHYYARELDAESHECHGGVPLARDLVRRAAGGDVGPSSDCNDNPDRVDVLLVYDNTARAKGEAVARALILGALAQANTVLSRSSLALRLVAAALLHVPYNGSGTTRTDLDRLRITNDGHMDIVHTWRRTHNADLVALIVGNVGGGIANCSGTRGNWQRAFSVSGYNSLGAQVLAHELGHNFGCAHDPLNVDCTPTSFGRGHNWLYRETGFPVFQRDYAYTVMSYSSKWGSCSFPWTCTRTRQPNFSSPAVRLRFSTGLFFTGTATRDNRRVIAERRQNVANYSRYVQGWASAPVITTQPRATAINLGYNAPRVLMSVRATGATRYQWRRNGSNITGQTRHDLSLDISNAAASLAGGYDCVVSGPCFSRPSSRVTLTVGPARVLKVPTTVDDVVAPVGDVDGDGYEDWARGRPFFSATGSGIVVTSGKTQKLIFGPGFQGGMQAGASFAGADINGDGHSDVLFGAPGALVSNLRRGQILMYSGKDKRFSVFATGSNIGLGQLLAAGQLDADGTPDVVTVDNFERDLRAYSGKTRRVLWSVRPFPNSQNVKIKAMATVGDLNNDGRDDILIGLPTFGANNGRIEIRSGRDGALLRGQPGGGAEQLGFSVAAIGDVDGDDVPDYATGAPGKNSNRGFVLTWSGRTGANLRNLLGGPGRRFGYRVASAGGDVNGDGRPDLIASAIPLSGNGRVRVLSGTSLAVLRTLDGSSREYGFGIAGFDANGDCKPDVLVLERKKNLWLFDEAPKDNPPAFTSYGATCAVSGDRLPRIGLKGPLPRVEQSFTISMASSKASSIGLLKLALGRGFLPLDALGARGCVRLYDSSIITLGVGTSSAGRAFVSLPIPASRTLPGKKLIWQWLVLDRAANALGLALSDAAEMRIGAKK